jgi:outer membrane protein assembly factor BamB
MRNRFDTRVASWRHMGLCCSLLRALALLALSACGTPQPSPPRAIVYGSSQAGIIYAINAQDGSLRWQYRANAGGSLAQPVLLNGMLYTASSNNGIVVYALNAQNGAARWLVKLNAVPMTPEQPVIVNNILYLVASGQDTSFVTMVYALRIQDGAVLWHYQTTGFPSTAHFSVAGGLVYLPLASSTLGPLLALDAATGAVRWQAHLPGTSNSTPAVTNGLVIIGNNNGWVYALRADTGALVWSAKLATPSEASTLAATSDLVYVGETNGSLAALRISDGALRWHVRLADIAFVPVAAQGMVYAVSDEGSYPVYALRASDGAALWHYQSYEHSCMGGVSITIANQVLYCTDLDSLILLDASSGQMIQDYALPTRLLSSHPVVVGPGE